ncbi:Dehydrogenase/reductase SDR member 12 [Phlyctochytrium bullatum]|nr:Dehydrogenase/reductase SDR member 12 [Phlyctochytrium bullatum]
MGVFESLYVSYRATLFAAGGYSQFTKSGYLSNAEKFTPGALDVNLQGKVAIVTGANSGATVHMLCRDRVRGQTARDEIANETSNPNVILETVDRQQVELTEYWAKEHPKIRFLSMHPGWADTHGVQTSIPGFYNFMKNSLRTADQGADTIVWAAIASEALNVRNGAFLFDRKETGQHLFMAGTVAPPGEIEKFISACDNYLDKVLGSEK